MATLLPASGANATLTINGFSLNAETWSIDMHANIIRCAAFNNPYVQRAVGLGEATITCAGVFDLGFNPNIQGIQIGSIVSWSLFVSVGNPNIYASDTLDLVQDFNVDTDADGVTRYQIVILTNGSFNDFSGGPA